MGVLIDGETRRGFVGEGDVLEDEIGDAE